MGSTERLPYLSETSKNVSLLFTMSVTEEMAGNEQRPCAKFSEDVTIHGNDSNSSVTTRSVQLSHHNEKGGGEHVQLTWRSWLVVFVTCFAQLAQVFVVVGSGQNIAFIARDLGNAELSSWIIRKYKQT